MRRVTGEPSVLLTRGVPPARIRRRTRPGWVALVLAVAAGTLALGAGLAWLVTAYRFPGSHGTAPGRGPGAAGRRDDPD